MGKCLVTKLNGSVNNDSLLKLNEFVLYGHSTNKMINGIGGFATKGVSQIKIIGDAYFTDKTGEQNLGKSKSIDISSEGVMYPSSSMDTGTVSYIKSDTEYKVVLSSKYEISRFTGSCNEINRYGLTASVYPLNVNSLKYLNNLDIFECDYAYMHTVLNKNEQLGINGDLSAFENKPNLIKLNLGGFYVNSEVEHVDIHINLTGELKVLASSIKLTSVDVENSDVYGKVEDLLNAMVSNGRKDGDIQIYAAHTNVTYEGKTFTNKIFTFASGSWSVKS